MASLAPNHRSSHRADTACTRVTTTSAGAAACTAGLSPDLTLAETRLGNAAGHRPVRYSRGGCAGKSGRRVLPRRYPGVALLHRHVCLAPLARVTLALVAGLSLTVGGDHDERQPDAGPVDRPARVGPSHPRVSNPPHGPSAPRRRFTNSPARLDGPAAEEEQRRTVRFAPSAPGRVRARGWAAR